jgi:hypothetical protein
MNWKNIFKRKEKISKEEMLAAYKADKQKEKEAATARKEAWVDVLELEVDPETVSRGNFELDWNEFFIARLLRFGYQGKTDHDLVDQWFNDVCRNVVLETFEQEAADLHPVKSRKLDDNKREYE